MQVSDLNNLYTLIQDIREGNARLSFRCDIYMKDIAELKKKVEELEKK